MTLGTNAGWLAVGLALLPRPPGVQPPAFASAIAEARSFGFTEGEIERILHGDVLSKELSEGSDEELAGVVAIWLPNPLHEYADIVLEGQLLKLDSSIRSLHVWKPDEPADEAIAELPADTPQRTLLKARYEAYRKTGLKGIAQLALAIDETKALERVPGYAKALLNFPAEPLPGMEHRFFAYAQDVEGRPTFILSHRAAVRGEHDALITEQRYYVSETYKCRFIATDCFEAPGGTLVFYVNRLFTDRVAGVGSSVKHALGRRKLLAQVVVNLRRSREQLSDPKLTGRGVTSAPGHRF